ncbi:hypothetical protein [Parapedobacter indicus]|uniref:Uncharacterized protein n=1 Tax=Parapedobacter indicus TaxID=1477437 RepID=A0A1I3V1B4_9SPHI|nr:hypothetical protein [Parapedobacter indicus]PPK99004.1 hypothetical protein CLV26_11534 [Parapedobacter indicus]SFJ88930.1 hypothetical protein SAMN05444682_115143 [Parapedobacter indicus]
MATPTKNQKAETQAKDEFESGYKSKLMLGNKVKTDIYTTNPKTVFSIEGAVPDKVSIELLQAIDSVLAKHRL